MAINRQSDDLGDDLPPIPPAHRMQGSKLGTIIPIILVSFIISVVVVFGMGSLGVGSFVTKKQFDANWQQMVASIDTAKAAVTNGQTALSTAVSNIPTTVTNQVNTATAQALTQVNNNINSLTEKVNNSASKTELTNLKNTEEGQQSTIAELKAKIKVLEDANYGKLITDLQNYNLTQDKTITDNYNAIKELKASATTTTTPSTTSQLGVTGGTSGGVTLTVASGSNIQIYSAGTYTYFLQLNNTSGVIKRVYVQALATPVSGVSTTYAVNYGTTSFTSTGMTFASPTFTPNPQATPCIMISSTTTDSLILGTGTYANLIPVTFTINYLAPATMWNISFTPIVTSL